MSKIVPDRALHWDRLTAGDYTFAWTARFARDCERIWKQIVRRLG